MTRMASTFCLIMKIIYTSFCAIGLFYQLEQISRRYFAFESRSEVQLSIPLSMTVPMVSFCWPLNNLMKKSWSDLYAIKDNVTIKDIFDQSPSSDNVLGKDLACVIRYPGMITASFPGANRSDCMPMLKVERNIQRSFVCYKITVKAIPADDMLNQDEYTLSPTYPGLVFRLFLNNRIFGNISYFTAFASSRNTSHFYDSKFSRTNSYMRSPNSTSEDYFDIELLYQSIFIERLKPPFDTACREAYPYQSIDEYWYLNFRRHVISELGLIDTFYPVEESTLELKPLFAIYLRNKTFLEHFNYIFKNYNRTYLDCHIKFYVSKISIAKATNMAVSVFWQQEPKLRIKYIPIYGMIDYALYVCSSFGIWFGVSVLSIGGYINTLILHRKRSKSVKKIFEPDKRSLDQCMREIRSNQNEIKSLRKSHRDIQIYFAALLDHIKTLKYQNMNLNLARRTSTELVRKFNSRWQL